MITKHPPGEPMTLGNMRRLGVHRLVAACLNDTCQASTEHRCFQVPG
jgi:hypothetical protein